MTTGSVQVPHAAALLRLAELLRYPEDSFKRKPDDSGDVAQFLDEMGHLPLEGVEEIYTWTFDLNPVASQEVGWHLWGEQYERGRFLADLRAMQAELGIVAVTELPDHLTMLLETLARLSDPAPLFVKIAPALAKIAAALEEQGNPYRHLIRGVMALGPVPDEVLPGGDCA